MKLCLNCQHCRFDAGYEAYSDVTPGEPLVFRCDKDVWSIGEYDQKPAVIRCLKSAEGCEHYLPETP